MRPFATHAYVAWSACLCVVQNGWTDWDAVWAQTRGQANVVLDRGPNPPRDEAIVGVRLTSNPDDCKGGCKCNYKGRCAATMWPNYLGNLLTMTPIRSYLVILPYLLVTKDYQNRIMAGLGRSFPRAEPSHWGRYPYPGTSARFWLGGQCPVAAWNEENFENLTTTLCILKYIWINMWPA